MVLADDHAVVRSALRVLLDGHDGIEVVAEAQDAREAALQVSEHHPDVLVLDLKMPGEPSVAAIPRILEEAPGTRIVVLTMQLEPRFARQALGAGAISYVLKDGAARELVHAIRLAARGEAYLDPGLAAKVAAAPREAPDELTPREGDVLELIAAGYTNQEAAAQLLVDKTHDREAPLGDLPRAAPVDARRARRVRQGAGGTRSLLAGGPLGQGGFGNSPPSTRMNGGWPARGGCLALEPRALDNGSGRKGSLLSMLRAIEGLHPRPPASRPASRGDVSDGQDPGLDPNASAEAIDRAARELVRAREAWHNERGEMPPEADRGDATEDAARVFIAEREAWFREHDRQAREKRADAPEPGEEQPPGGAS